MKIIGQATIGSQRPHITFSLDDTSRPSPIRLSWDNKLLLLAASFRLFLPGLRRGLGLPSAEIRDVKYGDEGPEDANSHG
jgi:hypothetical protein